MLKLFGKNPQCEHLGFGHCLIARCAIREYGWQLRYFREPTTIALAFTFNIEVHDALPTMLNCTRAPTMTPNETKLTGPPPPKVTREKARTGGSG